MVKAVAARGCRSEAMVNSYQWAEYTPELELRRNPLIYMALALLAEMCTKPHWKPERPKAPLFPKTPFSNITNFNSDSTNNLLRQVHFIPCAGVASISFAVQSLSFANRTASVQHCIANHGPKPRGRQHHLRNTAGPPPHRPPPLKVHNVNV